MAFIVSWDTRDYCTFEYPWKTLQSKKDITLSLFIIGFVCIWFTFAIIYSTYFSYPTIRRDLYKVLCSNLSVNHEEVGSLYYRTTNNIGSAAANITTKGEMKEERIEGEKYYAPSTKLWHERLEILSKIKELEESPHPSESISDETRGQLHKSVTKGSNDYYANNYLESVSYASGKLIGKEENTIDI